MSRTKNETIAADLADDFIAAAEHLEQQARELKRHARILRQNIKGIERDGSYLPFSVAGFGSIKMHRHYETLMAAQKAARAIRHVRDTAVVTTIGD